MLNNKLFKTAVSGLLSLALLSGSTPAGFGGAFDIGESVLASAEGNESNLLETWYWSQSLSPYILGDIDNCVEICPEGTTFIQVFGETTINGSLEFNGGSVQPEDPSTRDFVHLEILDDSKLIVNGYLTIGTYGEVLSTGDDNLIINGRLTCNMDVSYFSASILTGKKSEIDFFDKVKNRPDTINTFEGTITVPNDCVLVNRESWSEPIDAIMFDSPKKYDIAYLETIGGNSLITVPKATVSGANVSLDGALGLNIYVDIPDSAVESGAVATVYFDGTEVETVTLTTDMKKDGKYVMSCPVKAADSNKKVSLKIKDNDGDSFALYNANNKQLEKNTFECTIGDYVKSAIGSNSFDDSTNNLIKAMNSFAEYSAAWKNNTEVEITDTNKQYYADIENHKLDKTKFEQYKISPNTDNTYCFGGYTLKSASLLLDEETTLRLYYQTDKPLNEQTDITCNGETLTPKLKPGTTNKYYVDVANIPAHMLQEVYTVKFGNDEIKVSAMTYIFNFLNSNMQNNNVKVYNILKALDIYGEATKNYKQTHNT